MTAEPRAVQDAADPVPGDPEIPLIVDVVSVDYTTGFLTEQIPESLVFPAGRQADSAELLFYDEIWPRYPSDPAQILLIRANDDWVGYPIEVTSDGIEFPYEIARQCQYADQFREVAERLGRPYDLQLLEDLANEMAGLNGCAITGDTTNVTVRTDCDRDVFDVARRVADGLPEPEDFDPDANWYALSPEGRSLVISQLPADVVDDVVLVPIQVTWDGEPADDVLFTIRCELGESYSWLASLWEPIFPVPVCRNHPIVFAQEPYSEMDDKNRVDIGSIEFEQLNADFGSRVHIDFTGEIPVIDSVAPLDEGDLEELLEYYTLEQFYNEYSTPSTTAQ